MGTDAISPLRQRMIEDMNARKLGAHTQRSHISSCKRFAAFLKRSPDTATLEDIRRFQLHLAETGMSISNRNRIMTGLRFLLRVTLRRLDLAAEIYHIREPQKIPLVMSPDEKYLYYAPGAHGGANRIGAPVVQYEIATGKRKVLAFLRDPLQQKFGGFMIGGTYNLQIDPSGERLYITFNGAPAGARSAFGRPVVTVLHIPQSER